MALRQRRDPFTDLATSWQRDIDQMFRSLTASLGGFGGMMSQRADWMPSADVLTRGDDLVIRLEIPGIDPDRDVEITVEDQMLHVRGQRQQSEQEEREGYIRRETFYGSFERAIPLPPGAKVEDVKATYSDGFLEVVVPGAAKRATQRVPVQATGQNNGKNQQKK